jgi:hypothetical protein
MRMVLHSLSASNMAWVARIIHMGVRMMATANGIVLMRDGFPVLLSAKVKGELRLPLLPL